MAKKKNLIVWSMKTYRGLSKKNLLQPKKKKKEVLKE